jgi:hypothetical protein
VRLFGDIVENSQSEEEDQDKTSRLKANPRNSRVSKIGQKSLEGNNVRRSGREKYVVFLFCSNILRQKRIDDDFWEDEAETAPKRRKTSVSSVTSTSRPRRKALKGNWNNFVVIFIEPFLSCSNILEDLMDQESAIPFNIPVDPIELQLPDYTEIVKNPMDLSTIVVATYTTR